MVNIEKKVSEVLDKGLKTYPGTSDIYWDMGAIHAESIKLVNTLLLELAETVKVKYNLEYNSNDLMKENYEGIT